jgi:hypothetical protein
VRGLLLLLVSGCTVADPFAGSGPEESEVAQRSVIEPCPVGQWCIESPPGSIAPTTMLHGVWAIDENDVFAVGDGGAILRRLNGNEWFAMVSGTTSNLRAVWGSSSSDVWAGGVSGTLLHFDGTSWSHVTAPIANVDSIWGASPTQVYFVGSTTVLRWNGSTFTIVGFSGTLLSVSGSSSADVWVTGENTFLRRFNGVSWSTVIPPTSTGSTYLAVFARAYNDVWAATIMPGKETIRWNGIKWTPFRTDVRVFFKSFAGQTANDIWAAGNSLVGHFDGLSWRTEDLGDQSLWSITTAPGHVWVVGNDAFIAHRAQ